MKKMRFSIDIRTDQQTVWKVLWQDNTFREWAGIIDPGTYMSGELKEGGVVEFISAENGYGVTSLVSELEPNKHLLLKHQSDTQANGELEREKEWVGGEERYMLTSHSLGTILEVKFDVPVNLEEYFSVTYPKALQRIKQLAENSAAN